MIEIKCLNWKALQDFIGSDEFDRLPFVPISRHRAISHIHNPRADADDILLFLAYKENVLVGYLGVLADKIHLGSRIDKCGWLSCMWIDPNCRGLGISKLLVRKAFETWKERILVTEFTPAAKGLYNSLQAFNDLQINNGFRLYMRFDLQTLLPPKNEFFKKNKSLLRTIDAMANFFLDWRLKVKRQEISRLHIEYVNLIDEEISDFISGKQQGQIFKRGREELNWILNYPWVISGEDQENLRKRYHFSAIDSSFEFLSLKIRNEEKELIAFLMFAKRNNSLKLPYCYYAPNSVSDVIKVINFHLRKWKVSTFTVFHQEIVRILQTQKTLALYKKEIKRHYIISKVFEKSVVQKKYEIQDGDADCAFT